MEMQPSSQAPFFFDGKPIHPPIVDTIARELRTSCGIGRTSLPDPARLKSTLLSVRLCDGFAHYTAEEPLS